MEYRARLRYARISSRKLRLVADLIRGKNAGQAMDILNFSSKRGAVMLNKLLKSVIANASQNADVDTDQLYISRAIVGDGPIMKRWRAAARGRSAPRQRRTSHATLVVAEPAKPVRAGATPGKKEGTK